MDIIVSVVIFYRHLLLILEIGICERICDWVIVSEFFLPQVPMEPSVRLRADLTELYGVFVNSGRHGNGMASLTSSGLML